MTVGELYTINNEWKMDTELNIFSHDLDVTVKCKDLRAEYSQLEVAFFNGNNISVYEEEVNPFRANVEDYQKEVGYEGVL